MVSLLLMALMFQSPATSGGDGPPLAYRVFEAKQAGEAIAVISASCERCDWGVEGREAAALRISFDGQYSQHVLLARGSGSWEYRLTLGPVTAGTHRLFVHLDPPLSARDTGKVTVGGISTQVIPAGSDEHLAQSMAPF